MLKPIPETIAKLLPFGLLTLETLVFYAGFGWGLGTGIPKRTHYSNLQADILLFYVFGVFTFIFFVFLLPSGAVKNPFLLAATVFIIAALPSFFLSQALTDTLHLHSNSSLPTWAHYVQALEKCWNNRAMLLPAFLPHLLGFTTALILRKTIRKLTTYLKSVAGLLTFNPWPDS